MQMKHRFERFLTNWWLGLRSPWASSERTYSLVDWNTDSGLLKVKGTANSNLNKPNYYQVPNQHVLSSTIRTELADQSLASIVSATLPFDDSEVYATLEDKTLFTVLKSDIEPIRVAARSQNIELAGLMFDQPKGPFRLNFSAPINGAISATKFFSALGIISLIGAAMLLKYSNSQHHRIAKLQSQVTELQSISEQPQQEQLRLSGARAKHVIQALLVLKNTISEDTKLDQILLQSNESGLSVILDAESVNAASLLTLFEQSSQFRNSEFVTAISSDSRNTVERFRLKTTYIGKDDSPLSTIVNHD